MAHTYAKHFRLAITGLASNSLSPYLIDMVSCALLEDRALVGLSGQESRRFLQGLVTNDMDRCGPGRAAYAALLTPQGKILFDFFVIETDAGFLLDCHTPLRDDLLKRLRTYRLRTPVAIEARDDLSLAALWDGVLPADLASAGVSFLDPRLEALGHRVIAERERLEPCRSADALLAYHAHRLALGVPDSADLPPDTVFALDAGLEELNGVDFRKGCYVGQEVTARMKHRASARRRLLIVEADEMPPPGTAVVAGGRVIGTMARGLDKRALALVRLDRLAESKQADLQPMADGRPVLLREPDWLAMHLSG